MRRTYDLLAETFIQEGTEVCFTLGGTANMCFAAKLHERGCRLVHLRHEHCAVAASMAYSRKTGKIGVSTTTCGPGFTQVMTALTTAAIAKFPLVVFAGESPLRKAWYNQECNQAPYALACGADYHSLHDPARMAEQVRDAFIQARDEMRPVVIGVPSDLQEDDCTGIPLPKPSWEITPALDPLRPSAHDIDRAVELVARKKRITIVAGLGAATAGAGPACRALAERLDATLGTTLPNRGMFWDDPANLGIVGGYSTPATVDWLRSADLVIAVGSSTKHHTIKGGKLFPEAELLQIDNEPVGMRQGNITARHHIRADARLGVEALTAAVPARPVSVRTSFARRPAEDLDLRGSPFLEPGLFDPRHAVAALQAAIPRDWEMINTSGHVSAFTAHMPGRPNARFFTVREFGAIGNGSPYAIGVAAANPSTPVVLFDGDGSLMMNVQELETIGRHGLKVLVVAMNDGAYSSESHKLRARGLDAETAVFGRPDFAAIGRSFGLAGHTVSDLSDLPDLAQEFARGAGGAVWDIPLSDRIVSDLMNTVNAETLQPPDRCLVSACGEVVPHDRRFVPAKEHR